MGAEIRVRLVHVFYTCLYHGHHQLNSQSITYIQLFSWVIIITHQIQWLKTVTIMCDEKQIRSVKGSIPLHELAKQSKMFPNSSKLRTQTALLTFFIGISKASLACKPLSVWKEPFMKSWIKSFVTHVNSLNFSHCVNPLMLSLPALVCIRLHWGQIVSLAQKSRQLR